jgi:hypothetical protein
MFANLHARAAEVLAELLAQMPDSFTAMATKLKSPATVSATYKELDANKDGSVSLAEIVGYKFSISNPSLQALLPYIEQEMALGTGGEKWTSLPGASLSPIPSASPGGSAQWNITAGISRLMVGTSDQPPAVQLTGFCDGSVRTAKPNIGSINVRLLNSSSQALLHRGTDPSGRVWWGVWNLASDDGSLLNGLLIGLLTPPPGTGVVGGSPSGGAGSVVAMPLSAILIASEGTGVFARVAGPGEGSINWGDSFANAFSARFSLAPWQISPRPAAAAAP